jgi:tripartite-type tricarboxylate transporter receptor subunit TctC
VSEIHRNIDVRFLSSSNQRAAMVAIFQSSEIREFPSRAITIIVPFPSGSALDFLFQTIRPKMERALGQPVKLENRPGDTGNVGNAYVAKAAPDGYTLLMTAVNIGVFPHIFSNLPYDPISDFATIGEIAETPGGLVVNAKSKIKSLGDLISEAKSKPATLKFGSAGNGAPSHITVEMIARQNNVEFVHVPYKHAIYSLAAIVEDTLDFTCNGLAGTMPLIRQGKLRAIALVGNNRSTQLPDVPTVKESGFGTVDDSSHYILVAPAQTPKSIIKRLSKALSKALAEFEVQEALIARGFDLSRSTPGEVDAMILDQYVRWGPFIKDLGIGRLVN